LDRTIYNLLDSRRLETVRGAFDWTARRGWATKVSHDGVTKLIQIGEQCYRKLPGTQHWRQSHARDREGLCSYVELQSPRGQLELLRKGSDNVSRVGTEKLRGVTTTHYKARLKVRALKGTTVHLWIDRHELVRQSRFEDRDFIVTRQYFSFGVSVRVRRPTPPTG
jgi:hypothetical protein